MKIRLLLFVAVCIAGIASGEAQTERSIKVPGGPKVDLLVPMGYSFEAHNNEDGSVRIKMENPVWDILIQAVVASERDPNITKRAWQENRLVSFVSYALQLSQEDDYTFHTLPVESGSGVYCAFTAEGAPQPKPGEKISGRHLTGGLKAWPGCVVVFVIVSAERNSPEYQEAMDLFSYHVTKG